MKTAQKKRSHELIEHTADLGLRVFARSPEDLFINAAIGMFDIIADRKGRVKKTAGIKEIKFKLNLAARNREELLVGGLYGST